MTYEIETIYRTAYGVESREWNKISTNRKVTVEEYVNIDRETFNEHNCSSIDVYIYDEEEDCVDDAYYDIDDFGGIRTHSGDNREITMEKLEELLCERFGGSEYDRETGCYHDGKWFSINTILECVSNNI